MLNQSKVIKNNRTMQIAEMPKTYRERLIELEKGDSILIEPNKRHVWANNITAVHRDTESQYTIRTHPDTKEIRVWRLK
jgi:hypothetical protein